MSALTAEIVVAEAPTMLYRFYDAAGRLLYVGITGYPRCRWRAHGRRTWWAECTRRTVMWYPTLAEARAAETRAINDEAPLHNIKRPKPARVRKPRTPGRVRPATSRPPHLRVARPEGPGLAVYEARAARGLTLAEVARRCAAEGAGVTPGTLAKFERGVGGMRPPAVPVLAGVLGIEARVIADIAVSFIERQKVPA